MHINTNYTIERKVPGYVGTTIIMQGGVISAVRYIIRRFSDKASLDAWENSDESLKLIEEANNCSSRYYERATGLETWFTLPDLKTIVAPPKWKMALVAFIGANILADIHTGMETIAQIITSEIIAIIMEARSVIDVYWNPVREII